MKWAGVALPAGAAPASVAVRLGSEPQPEPTVAVSVDERPDELVVDTGVIVVRIPRSGAALIAGVEIGGVTVARDGRLVSSLQHTPEPDHATREHFTGYLAAVEVEQAGPVRAVIKLTGRHRADHGERTWLPFTVRLRRSPQARRRSG